MDSRDTDFKGNMPISADRFAKIMSLIGEGKISSRVAKDLLRAVIEEDKEPEIIAKERGLFSAAATDVTAVIDKILAEHASVVADYKGGKEAALQFLIGQGMRTLKGAVDPAQLRASIIERIAV